MNIEEKQPQQFAWHSLRDTERPDYGKHVLICCPYINDIVVQEAVYIRSINRSGLVELWLDPVEEYEEYRGVTHWMPMPMPPREARNDG